MTKSTGPQAQRTRTTCKIETIKKEIGRAQAAIRKAEIAGRKMDLELAIRAAGATRNKEPSRHGRGAGDIPRKW